MGLEDLEQTGEAKAPELKKLDKGNSQEEDDGIIHENEEEEAEQDDEENQSLGSEKRVLTEQEISERGAELLEVCRRVGDLERVQRLLDSGAPPNFKKPGSEYTPLTWAVAKGHTEVVSLLLQSGATDDLTSNDGSTPAENRTSSIHLAAYNGNVAILSMLMQQGNPITRKDSCLNTPLHLACMNGHLEVVKILLAEGLDLSEKNFYGNTALSLSTDPKIRELLMKVSQQTRCTQTNRLFTPVNRGYMCCSCTNMFAQECTERMDVTEKAGSPFLKRIRRCKRCVELVHQAELDLVGAMKLDRGIDEGGELTKDDLAALEKAMLTAQGIGADLELVDQGRTFLKRLEAKTQLQGAVDDLAKLRPLRLSAALKQVQTALANAKALDVDYADIEMATRAIEAAEAEISLNGHLEICSQIPCGDEDFVSMISRLEQAITDAERLEADAGLLGKSRQVHGKLTSELALRRALPPYEMKETTIKKEETGEEEKQTTFICRVDSSSHPTLLSVLHYSVSKLDETIARGKQCDAVADLVGAAEQELVRLKAATKEEQKREDERRRLADEEAAKKAKKAAAKKTKKK